MKPNTTVDAARLSLLLNELRLPAIKLMWPQFAQQADKEAWPAAYGRSNAQTRLENDCRKAATSFSSNKERFLPSFKSLLNSSNDS